MDYRSIVPWIVYPWLIVSCTILVKRSIDRRADARAEEAVSTPVELDRPSPAGPLDNDPAPAADPLPEVVEQHPAEVSPPAGPGAPVGGSIFDPAPAPEPGRSYRPIAEMVEGIRLPCDLTPLVSAERPIGARQSVAFVTRGHPVHEVGARVGDELRRLGFDLTPRHTTEVVATRGDDWLAVGVHDKAGTIQRGDRPAFPGAGDTAVVVELWTE